LIKPHLGKSAGTGLLNQCRAYMESGRIFNAKEVRTIADVQRLYQVNRGLDFDKKAALKDLIEGGAALNKEVEQCLRDIRFVYSVGYGMTECGPLISYEDWYRFKFHSCGKDLPQCHVRVDSNDPQHQEGELQVQGINVMKGYYKNEEATKAVFTADGWMRTGDLGIVDAEGNIFIKGRSKNMILGPSGQNIYP